MAANYACVCNPSLIAFCLSLNSRWVRSCFALPQEVPPSVIWVQGIIRQRLLLPLELFMVMRACDYAVFLLSRWEA